MSRAHARRPSGRGSTRAAQPLESQPSRGVLLSHPARFPQPTHLKAAPGEAMPKPASAASAIASEHAECRVSRKICLGVRTFLAAAAAEEAGGAAACSCNAVGGRAGSLRHTE